ncbi:MAG: DNA cytosine methyltransferase [Thermodesulfobacteriota bacterium]
MRIRTLDLFHGAGGSSLGALEGGAEIVAGIDFWNMASDCYLRNFPDARVINKDIRRVSPKRLHRLIGDIDLIIASPECTNHTCAKGAAARCEESRLTAFEVVRFAKEFLPKWIVIENVVHMGSWDAYPRLIHNLEKLGYKIKVEKLNAMDFGVPQSRRRLFIVCSLLESPEEVGKPDTEIKPASSVIDFNGNYSFSPLFSPGRAKPTIERAQRAMAELGVKEHFLIVYYGTDQSGGWQSLDRPLRTITTLDRFAYVKPSPNGHKMRMLQPEELKLAMGFKKSYILESGVRRDKVKLMGNAVCPPVMEYIVKSLISQDQ